MKLARSLWLTLALADEPELSRVVLHQHRDPTAAEVDRIRAALYREGLTFDEAQTELRRVFFPVPEPAALPDAGYVGGYREASRG